MCRTRVEAKNLRKGAETHVFKAGSDTPLEAVATKVLVLPNGTVEIRWELSETGAVFYEGLYASDEIVTVLSPVE